MEFDGERLSRRGIMVVTINYRLNVFGFLSHPEITAEALMHRRTLAIWTSNLLRAGCKRILPHLAAIP